MAQFSFTAMHVRCRLYQVRTVLYLKGKAYGTSCMIYPTTKLNALPSHIFEPEAYNYTQAKPQVIKLDIEMRLAAAACLLVLMLLSISDK